MKSSARYIVTGAFIGLFLGLFFVANGLVFKRVGDGVINLFDRSSAKQAEQFALIMDEFFLSFEDEKELNIFKLNQAGIMRSDLFATDGKYSMAIDFPPGPKYPGINFDMYGKHLLDWSAMKEFSFDVFNATPKKHKLVVQIRSGSDYPKRQYKKIITLPELGQTRVVITSDELKSKVSLNKISHLTIFMANPKTSFRLFVDNMRVK